MFCSGLLHLSERATLLVGLSTGVVFDNVEDPVATASVARTDRRPSTPENRESRRSHAESLWRTIRRLNKWQRYLREQLGHGAPCWRGRRRSFIQHPASSPPRTQSNLGSSTLSIIYCAFSFLSLLFFSCRRHLELLIQSRKKTRAHLLPPLRPSGELATIFSTEFFDIFLSRRFAVLYMVFDHPIDPSGSMPFWVRIPQGHGKRQRLGVIPGR